MTLYQIQSHNLEFENEFFSNIKKCVRVKSDTLNFLEWEKNSGNLELSASDFNRTHLKLPILHIVHWLKKYFPGHVRSEAGAHAEVDLQAGSPLLQLAGNGESIWTKN